MEDIKEFQILRLQHEREERRRRRPYPKPTIFSPRHTCLDLTPIQVLRRYRLETDTVKELCNMLKEHNKRGSFHVIQFWFEEFSLEDTSLCTGDSVTVRDNLGLLEIQGCGGTFHEEVGVIKSKNWPKNYQGNSLCLWTVEVPAGKRITVNFTHFEVEEPAPFTKKCFDNLVIYDEEQGIAEKYGPYCGTKLPPAITSKGNKLVMRFNADFFTEAQGFRAYWTTDPTVPPPTEVPPQPNPWDNIPIGNISFSLRLGKTVHIK
ncbi:UNVERIFIED_CONTAM: hypothetical protein FKN15_063675 [Acipenser sinensis]